MNIKLIGALTSKPYAFKARPWELENINSIDYHDAHGTNIRISVRGSEVLRVLPGINNRINEEWISDKVRFSYDGFSKQRLFYPFLKGKFSYKKISWEEAFKVVKRKFREGYIFNAIVGELIDLESLFLFKKLILKSGRGRLLGKRNKINNDFRSNYMMNTQYQDIDSATAFFIINSNIRYDSPILNLKIRENILRTGNPVFLFAKSSLLNYKVNIIAIRQNNLNQLYNIMLNQSKPLLYIKNNHLNINDNLLNSGVSYNILQTNSTSVAEAELNFTSKHQISEFKQKKNLIYMFNTTHKQFKKGFVVYQGHTANPCSNVADLILPGSTLLEKNGLLINNEGFKQETYFCVKPPALARNDWKIFEALSNYLGIKISYQNLKDLRDALSLIIPDRTSFRFYNEFRYVTLISNSLPQLDLNFYTTDIICRSSHTLALTANRFTKNRNNFKLN